MTTPHIAAKPPFWRNVKVLAWAFQIVVLAGSLAVLGVLYNNLKVNSANQGIPLGFDFLDQPSSFTIPANDLRQSEAVKFAIIEGLLNTIRVVVVGLFLSTILGVLLGIGRLSGNWLLRTVSMLYVEFIRNIPLLGIVIFAYLGVVIPLPTIQEAFELKGIGVLSGRGLVVPWFTGSTIRVLLVALLAGLVGYGVTRWRNKRFDESGEPAHLFFWVTPTVLLVFFWGAFLAGTGITTPSLEGRNVAGGMTLQPEYFALLLALVIYTASHIAEIVRGSIQAVPRGQGEAGSAMALSGYQRMRYVILPQATRIGLPALGNQYLNLFKNSSLGIVVSYFELTKVISTTIGNRSPAVPAYLVLMALYLSGSLIISAFINFFNRRLVIES